jgi:hypothetical protein
VIFQSAEFPKIDNPSKPERRQLRGTVERTIRAITAKSLTFVFSPGASI